MGVVLCVLQTLLLLFPGFFAVAFVGGPSGSGALGPSVFSSPSFAGRARVSPASPLRASLLPIEETLATKLLCASRMAEAIDASSEAEYDDDTLSGTWSKFIAGAGFHGTPTVVQGGIDNNDCCIVGRTDEGVVVAFRGTVTRKATVYSDWLEDLQALLVEVKDFPGKVHAGFYTSVANIWSPGFLWATSKQLFWRRFAKLFSLLRAKKPEVWLREEIVRQLDQCPTKEILVTGHSKGGAMAPQCAMLLKNDKDLPTPARVVTFASPNPGDEDFATAYDAAITQISFENYNDIVPLMPEATWEYLTEDYDDDVATKLSEFFDNIPTNSFISKNMAGYKPVGTRLIVKDDSGDLVTPDQAPDAERVKFIFDALRESDDDGGYLGFAHCNECTNGTICQGRYMAGVKGTPCICT